MLNNVADPIIIGMTVFLGSHLAVWRILPSDKPRMAVLALLALLGILVSVMTSILMSGLNLFVLSAVLWIQALGIVSYFFFYAGLSRSVSVTLLTRLLREDSAVEFDELVNEYIASSRFEDRVRLLEESGLVEVWDDGVRLTRRGARMGRWSQRLGGLIGSGLEG